MTEEYKVLNARINEIIANFALFVEVDPQEFDSKNQDLIKSFILLCHTELENYFENICKGIISRSKAQYDDSIENGKEAVVLPSLLSLALMSERQFNENDQTFNTVKSRIDKLYTNFFATVSNNNGIKEKDLKKLLPIIGVDMSLVDDTLWSQLDAYGTKRGQIAHTTQKQVRRFEEEKNSINNIIKTLEELDKLFEITR